jgi:hypothetical protein
MPTPLPSKVVVTKSRDVHTYSELWHASDCVLSAGIENPKGSTWQFLSSAVLTAFAFEAYLNHVGPTLFAHWPDLDRLSPLAKFHLICDKLGTGTSLTAGERPLQTVAKLLDFRNTMAHGRSQQLEAKPIIRTVDNYQAAYGEQLLSDWEKLIVDSEFASRAREDVKAVLEVIHEARPAPKEGLFTFGLGSYGATLVNT